jgi:hypothetical protein
MKQLLILSVLFFIVCLFNTAVAQELRIITLDQDDGLFAIPSRIVLSPGDTLQFKSINGDFNIYIEDAISFLKIKEADLKIRINSTTEPLSQKYEVRKVEKDIAKSYSIYCITCNKWPDAPPRIIIVSQ